MKKWTLGVFVCTLMVFSRAVFAEAPHPVEFPKDYRQWVHVKSMVIFNNKHPLFSAFGGIHHIYVNDIAYKAMTQKTDYPKGAVFAFDLLEIKESNGAYVEGNRKFLAVMERDAERFKDTEGWAWQVFEKGNPAKTGVRDRAAQKTCGTCHKEVGARHFVFTTWRE